MPALRQSVELERVKDGTELVAPSSAYAALLAALPEQPLTVVLTPSGRGAAQVARELEAFTDGVALFSDWETLE